jgi:hypothetical protein
MRDTIELAREAGFPMAWISDNDGGVIRWKDIKAFEALIRADEREACARVCDEYSATGKIEEFDRGWLACAKNTAAAIRARGNT